MTEGPPGVGGYRDDLARIHDAGFAHVARGAAPWLLEVLRQSDAGRGRVVDLGCGSGIWARELSEAGFDVLGIDQSAAMIALARRQAPAAEFRRASCLTAELPPCVAVTAVGEVFNYVFDPGHTPRALAGLFRRVYAALRPGGLFVFDTAGPGRVPGGGPVRNYREGDGWAVLFEAAEDPGHRFLTREITSFRQAGRLYRRDHETHRLRLYRPAELLRPLREAGFRARALRGYGPFRLGPGHFVLLARKA